MGSGEDLGAGVQGAGGFIFGGRGLGEDTGIEDLRILAERPVERMIARALTECARDENLRGERIREGADDTVPYLGVQVAADEAECQEELWRDGAWFGGVCFDEEGVC